MNPQTREAPNDLPYRAGRAALGFVLVTLLALVAVPLLVQRRVDVLRERIEASEPARTLISRLQFNLVREMAALSEVAISDDASGLLTYAPARAAELAIYEELGPLAATLGPEVWARFERARSLAESWHQRVDDEVVIQRAAEGDAPVRLLRERALFEEVLVGAAAMDSAVLEATAHIRRRIAETERAGLWLTVALALLALLAAIAVAALEARVRRYATESGRRRQEAEAALAEAAQANEARARLLRGITHDVKNPLGAARGYAELLALGVKVPMLPEQEPLVEGVRRSIDAALAIIADLLDLARVDSAGLPMRREPVDLCEVVRGAVETHRASAENAGQTLTLDSCGPLPAHTDPPRVQQVLGNLLSNAIKYSPAGGRITVRLDPGEQWIAVKVSDSGPGIPEERREYIFDEFTRLDESGSTGHGLGLAIARRIARLLGGDLFVEDAPDPGATFVLRLPREDASA